MSNCKNCNKELIQTEGKRPKKFCDNTCRSAHHRATKPKERKYIQRKTYDKLQAEIAKLKASSTLVDESLGDKINYAPVIVKSFDGGKINPAIKDEPGQWQGVTPNNKLPEDIPFTEVVDEAIDPNKVIWEQIKKLETELSSTKGTGGVSSIVRDGLKTKIQKLRKQLT